VIRLHGALSPVDVVRSPTRHVNRHQRLEQAAVVGHPQVKKLMCDDKILKSLALLVQVDR
jgi:hypothetical protein